MTTNEPNGHNRANEKVNYNNNNDSKLRYVMIRFRIMCTVKRYHSALGMKEPLEIAQLSTRST